MHEAVHFAEGVALHGGIGCVFAATGYLVRGLCDHMKHKVIVGGGLIFAESVVAMMVIH